MEMNQNQIMELLDTLYAKSINGIPKVSQPIDVLANDYLSKNNSIEKSSKTICKLSSCKVYNFGICNRIRRTYYITSCHSCKCQQCDVCSNAYDCLPCIYGWL